MSDKIITLVTFMYLTEAYPLMTRLENDGIECFLADENIVSVNPFLSNAIGGVKINIKEVDLEKAQFILEQLSQEKKKADKKVGEKWTKDFVPVEAYCPECESASVFRKKYHLGYFIKKYFCADCGHIWNE